MYFFYIKKVMTPFNVDNLEIQAPLSCPMFLGSLFPFFQSVLLFENSSKYAYDYAYPNIIENLDSNLENQAFRPLTSSHRYS